MIWPRVPQNASAQKGWALLKTIFTVWGSGVSILLISRYEPLVTAAVAGSATNSQLKTTSSAVKGLASCQVTPRLSFQVTQVRSRGSVPPFTPCTSEARTATTLTSGSNAARGTYEI